MSVGPPEDLTFDGFFIGRRKLKKLWLGRQTGKMKTFNHLLNEMGVTLIELLIVISFITILAAIGIPEMSRFSADYKVRSAATDLIQNMRLARAMAIKDNRQYLIVFDLNNQNYSIGPDADQDGAIDPNSVVRTVMFPEYGSNVDYGTLAPNGPGGAGDAICANGKACFGATNPPRADLNPDGSAGLLGSVYFQHTERGYGYCVRVSTNAGTMNMWKWDGDKDNPGVTTWPEVR